MYINYLKDRKELGFSVVVQTNKKNKRKRKIIMAVVVIWLSSLFSNEAFATPDLPSLQAFEVSLQNSCEFDIKELKTIIGINGGDIDSSNKKQIEINDDSEMKDALEMERLVQSIKEKCRGTDLSLNKCAKQLLDLIEPIVVDERFWRFVHEMNKVRNAGLEDLGHLPIGPVILNGPYPNPIIMRQEPKQLVPKMKSKTKSSSMYAEALQPLHTGRNPKIPMGKSRLFTSQTSDSSFDTPQPSDNFSDIPKPLDTFSEGLLPSGLSKNHYRLAKALREIERKTRSRRAQPVYPSQALANEVPGKSFLYSQRQLELKSKHLADLNLTRSENITAAGLEYYRIVEGFLRKKDLVRRANATMNKQEPAYIFGDENSKLIIAFEKNPLYDNYNFISAYPLGPEPFGEFLKSDNVGISKDERSSLNLTSPKTQAEVNAQIIAERKLEKELYNSLPTLAKISKKDYRYYLDVKRKLAENPDVELTRREKIILKRGKSYQVHRKKFMETYKKNVNDKLNDEL